jgi:hypothetical protein
MTFNTNITHLGDALDSLTEHNCSSRNGSSEATGITYGPRRGGVALSPNRDERMARAFDDLAMGLENNAISRAKVIKLGGAALATSALGLFASANPAEAETTAAETTAAETTTADTTAAETTTAETTTTETLEAARTRNHTQDCCIRLRHRQILGVPVLLPGCLICCPGRRVACCGRHGCHCCRKGHCHEGGCRRRH